MRAQGLTRAPFYPVVDHQTMIFVIAITCRLVRYGHSWASFCGRKAFQVQARLLLILVVSMALASLLDIGRAAQVMQKIVLHVGDRGKLMMHLGSLAINTDGARQPLSFENDGLETIANVEVKCGFFAGSTLVGTGSASARDLKPGSSRRADVVAPDVADADSVRCQISSD